MHEETPNNDFPFVEALNINLEGRFRNVEELDSSKYRVSTSKRLLWSLLHHIVKTNPSTSTDQYHCQSSQRLTTSKEAR